MNPDLLIPATAALLDGWCGPVVGNVYGTPEPCVLLGPVELDDSESTHYALHVHHAGVSETAPVEDIALDLSRAECRDRVARVLADTVTSAQGYTSGSKNGALWLGFRGLFGDGDLRFCAPGDEGGDGIPVPALAALDAYDDTRLPDGSRRVDAIALAIVARATFTTGDQP